MPEPKAAGVEEVPAKRLVRPAVRPVSNQGMAYGGEMDPDLVGAAGRGPDLKLSMSREVGDGPVAGCRFPAAVHDGHAFPIAGSRPTGASITASGG